MQAILITNEVLPVYRIYVLIEWPYVQDLMSQPWFATDCMLYQATDEQEQLPQAYFVPMERFAEAINQGLICLHV